MILNLLFPKTCFGCKKSGQYLCKKCVQETRLVKQICIECGKPAVDGMTHVKCLRPWGLDGCVSVWAYQKGIRKALIKLKYNFAFEIAKELSSHLAFFLQSQITALPKKAILVPIPLHRLRANWRGFNQTEEIGKLVAKKMGWKFAPEILIRKKLKRPQIEFKGDERKENIKGVFALNLKHKKSQLLTTNCQLLLFDDVLTTGATIREAGKVLKRSGVKKVWGLTIAS